MKLDDRPVIDQLTEPTPLNALHDVTAAIHDHIRDSWEKVQQSIDARIFPLLEMVPEDERDAGFERIRAVGDALCDEDSWRQVDLLEMIVKMLEARL